MVKKSFIEKALWACIFSIALIILVVFSFIGKNFQWINIVLILIFALLDGYFCFMTIKLYNYMISEKNAVLKDQKTTATYISKKIAYKLGDFKKDLITEVYKIKFSWVNELGETIIDESLTVFAKEQAENLENRGTFNVFVAHEKKAIIIYDKI